MGDPVGAIAALYLIHKVGQEYTPERVASDFFADMSQPWEEFQCEKREFWHDLAEMTMAVIAGFLALFSVLSLFV